MKEQIDHAPLFTNPTYFAGGGKHGKKAFKIGIVQRK